MNRRHAPVVVRRAALLGALVGALALTACATSRWHEDLMTSDQLMAASCATLTAEEGKLQDNIAHLNEAAGTSQIGAVLAALGEGLAGARGGNQASGATAQRQADLAANNTIRARDLSERLTLVQRLKGRRNCG
jgi:hypothetical protein